MNNKPTLRVDAYYDIQAALNEAIIKASMQNPIYKCCLSCEAFHEGRNVCLLVNKTPPARIITFGCEKWLDKDKIPF